MRSFVTSAIPARLNKGVRPGHLRFMANETNAPDCWELVDIKWMIDRLLERWWNWRDAADPKLSWFHLWVNMIMRLMN
jgi:hypothetical protein